MTTNDVHDADKARQLMDAAFPGWNKTFPQDQKPPTQQQLAAMWRELQSRRSANRAVTPSTDVPVKYYMASATHHRNDPEGKTAEKGHKIESKFTGKLPLVRIQLPKDKSVVRTITTYFGDVIVEDRLLPTLTDVNNFTHRKHPKRENFTRVDLLTPARMDGHRFAAVALYLCYDANKKAPTCYILEAGMAGGQPKMLYFNEMLKKSTDAPTPHDSQYTPTMFSSEDHTYTAKLSMKGDDPSVLDIKSFGAKKADFKPGDHYITVTVEYARLEDKVAKSTKYLPWTLIGEAAGRILKIAKAKEVPGGLMNKLGVLLFTDLNYEAWGNTHTWKTAPTRK